MLRYHADLNVTDKNVTKITYSLCVNFTPKQQSNPGNAGTFDARLFTVRNTLHNFGYNPGIFQQYGILAVLFAVIFSLRALTVYCRVAEKSAGEAVRNLYEEQITIYPPFAHNERANQRGSRRFLSRASPPAFFPFYHSVKRRLCRRRLDGRHTLTARAHSHFSRNWFDSVRR